MRVRWIVEWQSTYTVGITLTPFIPLSLRAIKGEGERKTEGCTCTEAQVHPSSLVLGGGEARAWLLLFSLSVNRRWW